jgi:hypothetical protein
MSDEIVGVSMVLCVIHVEPDVMEERGELQQLAGARIEPVQTARSFEELESEMGDVAPVALVGSQTLGKG